MSYIETRIAKKGDVLAAAKEGIKMEVRADYSEIEEGWRLVVLYWRGEEYWSYEGRLFRAVSQAAAFEHGRKQYSQLLGEPREAGRKFSAAYVAARSALEKKITAVWAAAGGTEPNLIKPGRIKFDWQRGEPMLKVTRGSTIDVLESRYNPEFAAYRDAALAEVKQQS
ncbi:hypothetical protein [Opitutus terrae]|uniref:Uncharacterized protein n=1 Tax=Opitutus terrae (strain DSM 11246 / JCM 15787 / PB90-1) TaxID=452637 RepID=B1ZXT3_OPITP|nr:hypothetical protein [Opitutus terrae]ACB74317.1 hypothetical protein Oter_1029 [Opitutus terrae PB90-1]